MKELKISVGKCISPENWRDNSKAKNLTLKKMFHTSVWKNMLSISTPQFFKFANQNRLVTKTSIVLCLITKGETSSLNIYKSWSWENYSFRSIELISLNLSRRQIHEAYDNTWNRRDPIKLVKGEVQMSFNVRRIL